MTIKPGARYWSTTSSTTIVVVKVPAQDVKLTCDGVPLADTEQPARGGTPTSEADGGMLLGKRYSDPDSGLEVLCTRAGAGVVAVDGRPVRLAGARALPTSD